MLIVTQVHSHAQNCINLGFELGDFTNWEGYIWRYSTQDPTRNTEPVIGFKPIRHTILSDQNAYDQNTGGELKIIPDGYNYVARLGASDAYDESPRNWNQTLRYTMDVTERNALLIIKYAVVLQFDEGHDEPEEPRFKFTLYNEKDSIIPDCANYDIYASVEGVEGFHHYIRPADVGDDETIVWRDWTTVGINLSDYIDSTITIEFLTSDCTQGLDFGYAYFVAECQPLQIEVEYCNDDDFANLVAPEGFFYQWTDNFGNDLGTNRIINPVNPPDGSVYNCDMVSETGCEVSIRTDIEKFSPVAGFTSEMVDSCNILVQFDNSSHSNKGIAFKWDFGDGVSDTIRNPLYEFKTSGLHNVELTITSGPCTSTFDTIVESFWPPYIGIDGDSILCPETTDTLSAYGAYRYEWSTGNETEKLVIPDSACEYWMLGYSSNGCVSDTKRIWVELEPEWELELNPDRYLCPHDSSSSLFASGAETYLWNTGNIGDTLHINEPGHYAVDGKSIYGCAKRKEINIEIMPLPDIVYTIDPQTINIRQPDVRFSTDNKPGYEYEWQLSDSNFISGSNGYHTFDIFYSDSLFYKVNLIAINQYGCIETISDYVDIIPFIPNVFTPNNDGTNDVFMHGLNIQVFDRNGAVIYEGWDGWDGNYQNQPAKQGTYFYTIKYSNRLNEQNVKTGYIMLIR